MGEDDPRLIGRGDALAVPTLDKLAPRLFARLGRVDHAMIGIGPDRLTCAPCGQLAGRILLPLNMLAPNLRNLDAAVAFVDHPERRPRPALLPLPRAPDQHPLGAAA